MSRVNVMDAYLAPVDIIAEVMQFHIQMFGPRAVFVILGHLNSSAVVFKYTTKYVALRFVDGKPAPLHFFHRLNN